MIPATIVFPVMVSALVWKGMIISLIGTGLQFFIWFYIGVDYLWDLMARFLIGSWCQICAYIFIWLFKLITMPILIMGAFWHIFLELMALPISGWMIFFGGSGCIFRWGKDCWFTKTLDQKRYWEVGDLPLLMKEPEDNYISLIKQLAVKPFAQVSNELIR